MPTTTIPPYFLQAGRPSCRPTNSIKALKATSTLWIRQNTLEFSLTVLPAPSPYPDIHTMARKTRVRTYPYRTYSPLHHLVKSSLDVPCVVHTMLQSVSSLHFRSPNHLNQFCPYQPVTKLTCFNPNNFLPVIRPSDLILFIKHSHVRFFVQVAFFPRLDISQRRTITDKPVVFTARLRPQFQMPPVRNAPELRLLHATTPPVQSEYPAERRAAAAVPLPKSP